MKLHWLVIVLAVIIGSALVGAPPGLRIANATNYASVDAGAQHTCAWMTSNAVQCWGRNDGGQLGNGTVVGSATAVPVSGLGTTATAVVTGGWHTCALVTGGSVKCWGLNGYGQVGDGTTLDRTTPTTVCASGSGPTCSPLTNVKAVAAGFSHTCAITTSGAVKCWGQNFFGQLGNGTTADSSNPVDVTGLASGVAAVAGGARHTCGLTSAGGVKCWGENIYGQLGNGSFQGSLTPVEVSGLSTGIAAVTAAEIHSCAVTTSGTAKCWGDNSTGQLGDGAVDPQNSPVDVCASGSGSQCAVLNGVTAVAAGDAHTCALVTGGVVKCWGWDGFGQLGDGVADYLELRLNPGDVTGLTGSGGDPVVAKLSAGSAHSCVVTVSGVVKCWGWNIDGQIGNGTAVDVATVVGADFDRDGCQDERELGTNAVLGGLRNPKSFWDFFDTPNKTTNQRDKVINQDDINRVSSRFGANDSGGAASINRYSDPFSAPPPTGYHPAYDRGVQNGPYSWNRAPTDGVITVFDALAVSQQNGHSCQ